MNSSPDNSLPLSTTSSQDSPSQAKSTVHRDHACQSQSPTLNAQPICCNETTWLSRQVSASVTEDHVREQLKQVIDPELFVNIVDLGLVYTIDLKPCAEFPDKLTASVEMTLTSPMCPAGPQLVANSRQVVEAIEGISKADIRVVMDPPWTPDRMTEEARDQLNIF